MTLGNVATRGNVARFLTYRCGKSWLTAMATDPSSVRSPRRITTTAAADRLGVSDTTVRQLIDAGEVGAIRVGRVLRVDEGSLDAYIERQTVRSA